MRASLARARETRAANTKARAELGRELGKAHAPAKSYLALGHVSADPPLLTEKDGVLDVPPIFRRKRRKLKKSAKTRLSEAIVQHKAAKKGLPDGWLDGIHHMPNGCPDSCR